MEVSELWPQNRGLEAQLGLELNIRYIVMLGAHKAWLQARARLLSLHCGISVSHPGQQTSC